MIVRVLIIMAAISAATSGYAEDRIPWKQQPEIITLVPGKERIVVLPGNVEAVDIPPAMVSAVRVQAVGDRVFLLTEQEFGKTRITISAGGQLYLIDLKGTKKGRIDTARILDPKSNVIAEDQPVPAGVIPEVALVRHVAQTLYAPARLVPPQFGDISKSDSKTMPLTFPLLRQQSFKYRFIGQWQGHGLYASAIELKNQSDSVVYIDPRDVRGTWRARSMQHTWVGKAGTDTDTTTLYLVSSRPLFDTLPELLTVVEPATTANEIRSNEIVEVAP